jgi:hypothetical protein
MNSLAEPTSMDAGKILYELTYAEGLPAEALKAASAQRVDMVPLFVQEIEHFLALDPGARAKSTPLFFIFHHVPVTATAMPASASVMPTRTSAMPASAARITASSMPAASIAMSAVMMVSE